MVGTAVILGLLVILLLRMEIARVSVVLVCVLSDSCSGHSAATA